MRLLGSALSVLLALVSATLAVAPAQAVSARDPIVLVHGWQGNDWNWDVYRVWFEQDGYAADELFAWDYDTSQSNATTAEQLKRYVDQVLAQTGADQVDIVTHSMGGLSSRHYLKNLGGQPKVDDWVSIGGPNHGTVWAWGCWQTSCQQMRPGSSFLTALNRGDETPGSPSYYTFWSYCDEVITPDESTILSGAVNSRVGCVGHLSLLGHFPTYAGVRDAIR
ncbi:MAG: alpha/beta fold hydrolase [Nocardioides sp.]